MCERVVEDEPETIEFVPDNLKSKTMCKRAVEEFPRGLENIPDPFKAQ